MLRASDGEPLAFLAESKGRQAVFLTYVRRERRATNILLTCHLRSHDPRDETLAVKNIEGHKTWPQRCEV